MEERKMLVLEPHVIDCLKQKFASYNEFCSRFRSIIVQLQLKTDVTCSSVEPFKSFQVDD